MRNKRFCIALILMLALFMFAGCSDNDNDGVPEPDPGMDTTEPDMMPDNNTTGDGIIDDTSSGAGFQNDMNDLGQDVRDMGNDVKNNVENGMGMNHF